MFHSISNRSFSLEYLKVAAMSENKSNKFSFLVNDWKGSKRLPHVILGGGFKHFICSPRTLGKWSNLTSIFFGWVGSTTNQFCWNISIFNFVIGEAVMIDFVRRRVWFWCGPSWCALGYDKIIADYTAGFFWGNVCVCVCFACFKKWYSILKTAYRMSKVNVLIDHNPCQTGEF